MRNYNNQSKSKDNNKANLLKCPECNKKYKTELKRQNHVEKDHYYATRCQNHFKFGNEVKAKIYNLAASYIVELHELRKDPYYGNARLLAKNLLPQLYNQEINSDELDRIMVAHQSFANKLLEENLYSCNWENVMDDLELFFNMGLPYYDTNFCPTLAIDFLWHSMMQDPNLYIDICEKSLGVIMPHCLKIRNENEDLQRYQYFLEVFQYKYNKLPCSFPGQNAAISNLDTKEVLIKLSNKELKEAERKRILKEKRCEEEERIQKERREKYKVKKEAYDKLTNEISEHVGTNLSKLSFYEIIYLREGYEKGYRDIDLKEYVNECIDKEARKPSTC